jgi:glucose-1-phosphate adenylyltransferase
MTKSVLGIIMAGGKGTRLYPLTRDRAKPAVPFGGKYRIIDFVLSNFVNSGIYSIYVLTQFKSQSLVEHLKHGWQFGSLLKNHFITHVPAQMRMGDSWYKGTADAIYQNIHLIERTMPDIVAIFGADHIYRMDISQMLNFHIEKNADVTVSAITVNKEESHKFGCLEIDNDWRIKKFHEKPEVPVTMPEDPDKCLASMGNYIFNTDILLEELKHDAGRETEHDFGRSILPDSCDKLNVYAYDFKSNKIPGSIEGEESEANDYWRDVGAIDDYYEANMELKSISPKFNLYNERWPLRTAELSSAPVKFAFNDDERRGMAVDSIISAGTILSGCKVSDSVLGRNIKINSFSEVTESILFDKVEIGRNCKIKRAIIDKHVKIPPKTTIGYDLEKDRKFYHVTDSGIVVIPRSHPRINLRDS